MRVYVDASAAIKLFVKEAESQPLRSYLSQRGDAHLVSSVLLETELRRTAIRKGAPQSAVTPVLHRFDLVAAPRALFQEAGLLAVPGLRTLDALHLATAMREDATVMLAYDHRLIEAAEIVGLPTESPN